MNEQALANRERRMRWVRLASLLAAAGGIAVLVAGSYLVEDATPGAALGTVAGLAALAGGVVLAVRLLATVRYRIAKPYSGVWLTAKILGALGVFVGIALIASALEVPSVPRRVLVVVLVAGLGWLVTDHNARSTLFQADATGTRFGRTPVPWTAIAQLVVAPGAAPGFAEIGATPVAGASLPAGEPIPGAVLADLPVHTVVHAQQLDWNRLTWAITQSGRTDLALVPREAAEPQEASPHTAPIPVQVPGPPRTRSPRVWWVAGGLAVALVAGVATAAVILKNTDNDGDGVDGAGSADATYHAPSLDDACDVMDVYVLKKWSTEQRIKTEQSSAETEDGQRFDCRAFSDSEYVEGRMMSLNVVVVVADDADAADAVYREEKASSEWDASGDVTEDGDLRKLADVAQYERSISTGAGYDKAAYALTVRDSNLVLLLRFQSESDRSDGDGATVEDLADTAAEQATAVMIKFRAAAEPNNKEKKAPKPARVPDTVLDAAEAETTGPLMDRVRAVDPCELHDHDFAGQFGSSVAEELDQAQAFDECRLVASEADPAAPRIRFTVNVVEPLTTEERVELETDKIDGHEVFHEPEDPASNSCDYYFPYESTGFGAMVSAIQYVEGSESQASWPDACATAKSYFQRLVPSLEKLPERSRPAPEPTLVDKDPCATADTLVSQLGDWEQGPILRLNAEVCQFTVSQGEEEYTITMDFDRDAEQLGDEPATIGGLTGTRINSYEGMCSVSLVFVPESSPEAWDAQNIGASVDHEAATAATGSLDPCQVTTAAAELMIGDVR